MNITLIKPITAGILLFLSLLSFHVSADGQRHIHVNGEHLSDENISLLDQIVGNAVGDGYYWINMQSGEWGFQDHNETQGVLANIANQSGQYGQSQYQNDNNNYNQQANQYNDWEGVSGTGSVTSGNLNGQNCTFVSVGGTTMKSCD